MLLETAASRLSRLAAKPIGVAWGSSCNNLTLCAGGHIQSTAPRYAIVDGTVARNSGVLNDPP